MSEPRPETTTWSVAVLRSLRTSAITLVGMLLMGAIAPAAAHPHIWVSVRTTVLYDNAAIVGFRHAWTFDQYYSVMAIEGLDTDKDGKYSRAELAELAKVNVEALKEFAYFTFPRLKGQDLAVEMPKEYYLEHAMRMPAGDAATAPQQGGGVVPRSGSAETAEAAGKPVNELTLHFTLPLAKPVLAEAEGFTLSMGDPSFFIAFEAARDQPIALGPGAPKGCRITSTATKEPEANPSKPGDLMASQPADLAVNLVAAPSWQVICTPAG
jgi:ABC-type uncharacterized transport system substrate-binding protein